jgi:S-DNA-T family DNA segregation ATPase FtsK/SpoIIIE
MSRTASIKRAPRRKAKTKSLLPEAFQAFIARRLWDIVALFLLISGAFMALSFFSYDSADPSWNTAQTSEVGVQNWMGGAGAWASDIVMQSVGVGGFAWAFICGIWGWRLLKRRTLSFFALRVIAFLLAPLLVAMACARLPAGDFSVHPYLGGTFGTMIQSSMITVFDANIATGFAIFAAIFLIGFACCISRHDIWTVLMRGVAVLGLLAAAMWGTVIAFKEWVAHYNDPDYKVSPSAKLGTGVVQKFKDLVESWKLQQQEQAQSAPPAPAPSPVPKLAATQPAPAQEPPFQPTPHVEIVKPKDKPISKASAVQTRFALNDSGGGAENWEFPPLTLLQEPPETAVTSQLDEKALQRNAELLQNVLADFNVQGDITSIYPGPVVTLYELEPSPGTKTARVISISDDIARSMSAISVRAAVVPGRNVIGIELPNKDRQVVYMHELLASSAFDKSPAKLPLGLGTDIGGQPIIADLAKMPHLLVAGTTGSGKSVAVNTMILSLLFRLSPEQCRFIMIDPKMLELSVYDDIPHLLAPVVTEPGKAVVSLKWAVNEMENRYRSMSKMGVRNIDGYNTRLKEARDKGEVIMTKVQTGFDPENGQPTFEDQEMDLTTLPYIVIIVDEFADLMLVAGKDVENAIQRLAQMARAAGIHLIMATQRPSVDVITGVIKANFPTRISFQVTSKIDSRTILGEGGAEQLLGMGDMLYMAPGGRVTRVHGPFVSDEDVEKVVDHLKSQQSPSYVQNVTEDTEFGGSDVMNAMFGAEGAGESQVDELYDVAVALVAREGKASTSFVQRHLQIGYNRAARIVEEMEKQGVISPATSTGKREVLVGNHGG